ncbi:integrin alpha-10 [Nematolebias whitei]|uniref:integrin alpha-10 n=1 Tax=Nematolebias whitei TaxID=451745 RepID=UPI0018981893|nr:integrin alpha-10 [Nematolebias whitei]
MATLCQCFNIDVQHPKIFTGPEDALFGFSVLQHEADGEKSLLVGAPWDGSPNNRKGDVYKCVVGEEKNSACSKVNLGETALQNVSKNLRNSHLGMTLTPDSPDGFLACAPLWSQECGTSMFSTGICASVSDNLEPRETIAPTAQKCRTFMDIVIVVDGSNSIYPWSEVQNFLSNILSKFHISLDQMQVGIIQYAEIAVHEWSLKDYQTTQEVVEAAKNISRQEGRETRTADAILVACTEAFSAERGAREGATKVMIVVTDGESHDVDELPAALDECDSRNITRYAIAVLGYYIRKQQDPETFISEIKYIASDPDEKYFFNVTDEPALNDIVDALGDRIFTLEGTLGNQSTFHMEMSQVGFSTHTLDDGILFGIVGAYDWDGGVLKTGSNGQIIPPREAFESEFPLELKNHAAYLGPKVSPLNIQRKCEFVIYVHAVKSQTFVLLREGVFIPNGTLQSEQTSQNARFGYVLAAAPDLNHDGFNDLVVGAPLEDEHKGAIYVYHGHKTSIIHKSKQRIAGSSLSPSLQYFGRSVSTRLDLDGDGLIDLAVGAQGRAVLLSSRSIVQINVSLSFQPHSINVIQKTCQRGGRESACLNATACFKAVSRSPETHSSTFDLWVSAMLDDRKLSARALFDDSSHRQIQLSVRVQTGVALCYRLPFHVYDTADYIRPISFSLQFKINNTETGPVLDEGWPTTVKKSIPFFKDCGEDDVCTTDLVLQAHMDISGTRQKPYVIHSPRRRLAVEVQLQNIKENAYNTSLKLHYSRNLHFSSLSIREDPNFKMECTALGSNSHSCNVSYPVFRSRSKVNFMLEFEFSCTSLQSRVQMKLIATSDSMEREDTLENNSVQLQTFVQYQPDLFVSSISNLNRYEVHPTRTASEAIGPEFYTHFRLQNLGCYTLSNLELHMFLPSVAAGDAVFMTVTDVNSFNATGVNCSVTSDVAQLKARQRDVRPLHPEDMLHNEILNCSRSWCTEVVCEVQQLGHEAIIRVTRRVHDDFFRKAKYKSVRIVSAFDLTARETSLITLGAGILQGETVLEVLKGRAIPISLWILIGSIIGGLLLLALIIFILWKLGFFTRKHREDENHED